MLFFAKNITKSSRLFVQRNLVRVLHILLFRFCSEHREWDENHHQLFKIKNILSILDPADPHIPMCYLVTLEIWNGSTPCCVVTTTMLKRWIISGDNVIFLSKKQLKTVNYCTKRTKMLCETLVNPLHPPFVIWWHS